LRRLVIRPGGIGDSILSFPAIEFLKPDEVWVRSEIAPLVRFAPVVRSIASTGLDLLGIADIEPPEQLIDRLRSFDDIVSWYGTNRPEFRGAVARLKLPFRFFSALPHPDAAIHAADFYAQQAGAPLPAIPRIDFGRVQKHDAAVLHPFSGSPRKNWPLTRFEELANALAAHMPVEWAARPDWVRFDNLNDLGKWLAGARVYAGNDTGVTHLAAAAGVPTVALFGPTDPRVWAPRSARVRVIAAPTIEEIEVEATLRAIRELAWE
jgi:ADP-heptose:LPS heptosyltransferase